MGEFRTVRIGEQLREEIAKVYVSSFLSEGEIKKGVDGLNSAAGFIQNTISKKLRIYKFPRLTFIADSSLKEGFDMVAKLNRLEAQEHAESEENQAE